MRVLSLFDGMSCGQIALNRVGIEPTSYYASEIDKYAIEITNKNYPETKQLGDVKGVSVPDGHIDLLLAGSPCQGFSHASGDKRNFDDPRSALFWEFIRVLRESKPKYFLLENVVMNKESQDIITKELGVEPITINSGLHSAQNRIRLYWTNIPFHLTHDPNAPRLKDIIHSHDGLKTFPYEPYKSTDRGACRMVGKADLKTHDCRKRIYSIEGKSPTLTTASGGYHAQKIAVNDKEWRYLTTLEYERLQTVPDNYTEGVSNTQRYNMLGNGWCVNTIATILKGLL